MKIISNLIKLGLMILFVGWGGFAWALIPQSGNLVTHYPFSGNANDSANSYDGTLVGSPTLTTDRHGSSNSAYLFDGVDDWIKFGVGSLSSGNGDPFTISVWAKSSNSATQDLVGFGGNHCSLRPMVIRLGSNINFNSCNNAYDTSSGGSHNDGNWHHWAFTWNGSNQRKVYKDGTLQSTSNSGAFNINNEGLVLGRNFIDSGIGTLFSGSADELRLWDVALTTSEVSDLYDDENAPPTDTTDPTLSSSTPADNATSVAANTNIVLNFSEAVDVESGDITIKKTSDNSTVATIAVGDAQVTGTGTTAITINPTSDLSGGIEYYVLIDAIAFDDSSSNSYAGISSTTALSFTIADTTNPTISSTTVASDNSTIDVTFSEAVFNATGGSGALQTSDFIISISGGTKTLSSAIPSNISISGNVYTLGLSLSGSANGSEVITVVPSSSTAIYDESDNAASTSQSNNTVSLNSEALPSPLNKKDVVGSVEAWTGIVSRWANSSIDNIFNRIDWLRRHQDTTRTSHQGIKLHFEDKVIDAVMNTSPNPQMFSDIDYSSKAASLLQNTDGSLVAVGDHIKSDVTNIAINQAARIREDAIGSLNPTFGPVVDNWSIWTEGKVLVGKKDASSTASKQEIDAQSIAIGFDKPVGNDGLVGFVINIGQDNTDVGTDSTNVKSDNYSLSSYRVFGQGTSTLVESVIGIGHLDFDTVRTDGSDTLSGARKANQIFLSTALRRGNNINHSNWVISPYTKLSLAHTRLNSFSESGGITALTFNKQSINDAKIRIGIDTNALIAIDSGTIKPFGKIEYNASASDTSAAMHYNSESTNYTSDLDKTNRNWRLEYGADFITKDGWSSSASYMKEQSVGSGETSQYSDSFRFNVGVGF